MYVQSKYTGKKFKTRDEPRNAEDARNTCMDKEQHTVQMSPNV